jgi:flagellar hook-basal body complex protein FliE
MFFYLLSYSSFLASAQEEDKSKKNFYHRLLADQEQIRLFNDYSNTENLNPKLFFPKLDQLVIRLESSLDLYRSIPETQDEELKQGISKVIQGMSNYKNGLQQLKVSILDNDSNALDLAVDKMQEASHALDLGVQVIRGRQQQSVYEIKTNKYKYFYAGAGFAILGILFLMMLLRKRIRSF